MKTIVNEPAVTTEDIILDVEGKPTRLTFIFIGIDITTCLIHGLHSFTARGDIARTRIPVNGVAVKHPKDDQDINYGMRLATKRCCQNIDPSEEWQGGMGKIGAVIYQAFRIWQRDNNRQPLSKALHV